MMAVLPIEDRLDFHLPSELEATKPPEVRGSGRDDVWLMVSHYDSDTIVHTHFHHIANHFQAGDVLVINTSGTMNAALNAVPADGTFLRLHVSTALPGNLWIVELRKPTTKGTEPYRHGRAGQHYRLPGRAHATILTPYNPSERLSPGYTRLWIATIDHPATSISAYLAAYGMPIRYQYVDQAWDSTYYQTVYADEMGSAEMPSAGRAFTFPILDQLRQKGVEIAPLILHTGVASQEDHEPPYEEPYRVPYKTAELVTNARQQCRRVVAVGTTVVRALETVTDERGITHAGEGWTDTIISPERGVRAADGLLTGFHEPRASHLSMLESFSGRSHLKFAYQQALDERYLWHEFGDLHLLIP